MEKTSCWLSSDSFGSWWAANVAIYCSSRMTECPKLKSMGEFFYSEWSPCTKENLPGRFVDDESSTATKQTYAKEANTSTMKTIFETICIVWGSFMKIRQMFGWMWMITQCFWAAAGWQWHSKVASLDSGRRIVCSLFLSRQIYLNHHNMKSISITWTIFSQTWAKHCFYKRQETEKVTQDHYPLYGLKS